jgi:hypothetical protein
MTVNERLSEYLKSEKISDPDIYKKIGVGQSTFAGWLKQGKAIPLAKLQMIVTLLPELNVRWLLTGDSESKIKEYAQNSTLRIVEDSGSYECKLCQSKDKTIAILEKYNERLEFDLGKLRRNGSV